MNVNSKKRINFYHIHNKYGEFSNFYPSPIEIEGTVYPTSEHYFQAMKFVGTFHHDKILQDPSPSIAAKLGRQRSRPLRNDWEEVKDEVMEKAVRHKFSQHLNLRNLLMRTGSAKLVEHTRNDSYWGDGGDGSGKNMLGITLMKVRSEFLYSREEQQEKEEINRKPVSKDDRVPGSNNIPRVTLHDTEAAQKALRDLGVCIFSNVASAEELEVGKTLFWDWLEQLPFGFDRAEINSINNENWENLGYPRTGIISKFGIGHSPFMWYCRQLPGVLDVFQTIWETDDLITSFDGCGTFRNIWHGGSQYLQSHWITDGGWYHVDQNGKRYPGLQTYQGLLNFYPASEATGSTIVVPESHKRFLEIFSDGRNPRSDFVSLSRDEDVEKYCQSAVQVTLEPGDFLVWDSRIIHCSQGMDPNERCPQIREDEPLARLVAFICMVPTEKMSHKCQKVRMDYVQRRITSGHNPLLFKLPHTLEESETLNYVGHPCEENTVWNLIRGKVHRKDYPSKDMKCSETKVAMPKGKKKKRGKKGSRRIQSTYF